VEQNPFLRSKQNTAMPQAQQPSPFYPQQQAPQQQYQQPQTQQQPFQGMEMPHFTTGYTALCLYDR